MFGWTGKILHLDLTSGTHHIETPTPEFYATWIGGKGMAGYYLAEAGVRAWDDPKLPLLFFTGPLVGTASPTSGRMTIMSRSPQTGTICDTSVGGHLGLQLKRAGWDGLVLTGSRANLGGLLINNDQIQLVDATGMAGMTTNLIGAQLPEKSALATIGPAAEQGVAFSTICVDGHHFAGRGGLGLVMAAKKLKFIAVKGSGIVPVNDKNELARAREDIMRLGATSPVLQGELGIIHYGTAAVYDLMDSRRMMPTDNFRETHFPGAAGTNAFAFHRQYKPTKKGCAGCYIRCKMFAADGRALPEFETMSHFTALIGNQDRETVMEANRLCNELGLDTISAGAVLACHQEIGETKFRPGEILALLTDIGRGQGSGKALGKGALKYAQAKKRPETAMTVKGLELPAYDPRGAYGMALAYALSTRGGCHLRSYPVAHEIFRKPVATDRFSFAGKARIVKIAEDANSVIDSLTACRFLFFAASLEEYARAFTAVTGVATTAQDLLHTGERIYYQERQLNWLYGFTGDDDDLPERFFHENGSSGEGIEIGPLPRDEFLQSRAAYYRVRGLDAQGNPERDRCEELGLTWKER